MWWDGGQGLLLFGGQGVRGGVVTAAGAAGRRAAPATVCGNLWRRQEQWCAVDLWRAL